MEKLNKQLLDAHEVAPFVANLDSTIRSAVLQRIASALLESQDKILFANCVDVAEAEKRGLAAPMIERMRLSSSQIQSIAEGVRRVADLPDPLNQILETCVRPNGLKIEKVSVPIGVLGIIYEARPNVSVDIVALCLKTGNVCVLKGGSEVLGTNRELVTVMHRVLCEFQIPESAITFIDDARREVVLHMITQKNLLDLVIPRGGKGLIDFVVSHAKVPVIETGAGNCHLYIDEFADPAKAVAIAENAKVSRPSVCNAIETILIHEKAVPEILPKLVDVLKRDGVEIRGCSAVQKCVDAVPATDLDFATEYNDYIVTIKVVPSMDEALAHIAQYSTHHSEAIITENKDNAEKFMRRVDSACVYHNASTRFTDGGEFGFGAELGISTQKLHARGPMGLREMTAYKYKIYGNGQVR